MLSEDIKIAIAILVTMAVAFILKRFFGKMEAETALSTSESTEKSETEKL